MNHKNLPKAGAPSFKFPIGGGGGPPGAGGGGGIAILELVFLQKINKKNRHMLITHIFKLLTVTHFNYLIGLTQTIFFTHAKLRLCSLKLPIARMCDEKKIIQQQQEQKKVWY